MPKQNRVTPFGDIIAVPERGTMMGNRGVLHDEAGHLRRSWQLKRWIVCVLEFRGRHRQVMAPGRYTELFFLDEATAFAAGHRPCAECRYTCFRRFCDAWGKRATAPSIDEQLHVERLTTDGTKPGLTKRLGELPDGVMVTVPTWGDRAYLIWQDRLLEWSPGGYGKSRRLPKGESVKVLTPKSTVQTIAAGYVPEVHPSAVP